MRLIEDVSWMGGGRALKGPQEVEGVGLASIAAVASALAAELSKRAELSLEQALDSVEAASAEGRVEMVKEGVPKALSGGRAELVIDSLTLAFSGQLRGGLAERRQLTAMRVGAPRRSALDAYRLATNEVQAVPSAALQGELTHHGGRGAGGHVAAHGAGRLMRFRGARDVCGAIVYEPPPPQPARLKVGSEGPLDA